MTRLFGRPDRAWLVSAVIAAALLVGAIFTPLWSMELVAPQYPSGLKMYAYGDRFEGDTTGYYEGFDVLREINGLNHYIGMKAIEEVTEMTLFIPGMLATVAGLIIVSFIAWHSRWFKGLMISAVWFLPLFFLADLQYWLYNYGHTMKEDAALNTGGFTPKVIGTTKVWNFHSETMVEIGFFLMLAAALVISFLPPGIRWVQSRRRREAAFREPQATGVGATPAQREMA